MKNYRKSLPPLDNLPFFLSAARNKSLSAAAGELFVTQAAVSKRIHRLESWLGVDLFQREKRNLKISNAGKEFASDVEIALDFLDRAVRKIKTPEEPMVRIATGTTISAYWLYDRLQTFSRSENACNVYVTTSDSTSELTTGAHELFVLFCDGEIPGLSCAKIFDCELTPAAAPDVADFVNQSGMFTKHDPSLKMPPLLEYSNMNPDWVNWELWLKEMGMPEIKHWPTLHCNSFIESIAKARAGLGIGLLHQPMMQQELDDGTLVKINTTSYTTNKSYFLCHYEDTRLSQNAKNLLDFLSSA